MLGLRYEELGAFVKRLMQGLWPLRRSYRDVPQSIAGPFVWEPSIWAAV